MPATGLTAASSISGLERVSMSVGGFMERCGSMAAANPNLGIRDREFLFYPIVALGLEFKGEALVATLHEPAVIHDVHEVRHDVVQEALVMRDHDHTDFRAPQRTDALGDNSERVDVE